VLSRNRKTFAVSSLVLNLFAFQIGEFFLLHSVYIYIYIYICLCLYVCICMCVVSSYIHVDGNGIDTGLENCQIIENFGLSDGAC